MNQKSKSSAPLIFSCSGASDVGELADRTARRLSRSGLGKMFCLATVGGKLPRYIDEVQSTKDIIIIDGCLNDCSKKILGTINVQGNEFNLEKLGFEKGKSPASGENTKKAFSYIKKQME